MARPEDFHHSPPTQSEIEAALALLQQRIEKANENENTIERTHALDRFLEEQDALEDELEAVNLTNTSHSGSS